MLRAPGTFALLGLLAKNFADTKLGKLVENATEVLLSRLEF